MFTSDDRRATSSRAGHWLSAALLLMIMTATTSAPAADAPIPTVDQELLRGFLADEASLTLIDARSAEEYSEQHVPGAINIPFDALDAHVAELPADLAHPVIVYCRSGHRAGILRTQMLERGYSDVQVLPREQLTWDENQMILKTGAP